MKQYNENAYINTGPANNMAACDSIWSIVQKLTYWNSISVVTALEVLRNKERTMQSMDWRRATSAEEAQRYVLHGHDLTRAWPRAAFPFTDLDNPSGRRWLSRVTYCEACAIQGIHTVLHWLPWFAYCPVHGAPLKDCCVHCGRSIGLLKNGTCNCSIVTQGKCICGHRLLHVDHRFSMNASLAETWNELLNEYFNWIKAVNSRNEENSRRSEKLFIFPESLRLRGSFREVNLLTSAHAISESLSDSLSQALVHREAFGQTYSLTYQASEREIDAIELSLNSSCLEHTMSSICFQSQANGIRSLYEKVFRFKFRRAIRHHCLPISFFCSGRRRIYDIDKSNKGLFISCWVDLVSFIAMASWDLGLDRSILWSFSRSTLEENSRAVWRLNRHCYFLYRHGLCGLDAEDLIDWKSRNRVSLDQSAEDYVKLYRRAEHHPLFYQMCERISGLIAITATDIVTNVLLNGPTKKNRFLIPNMYPAAADLVLLLSRPYVRSERPSRTSIVVSINGRRDIGPAVDALFAVGERNRLWLKPDEWPSWSNGDIVPFEDEQTTSLFDAFDIRLDAQARERKRADHIAMLPTTISRTSQRRRAPEILPWHRFQGGFGSGKGGVRASVSCAEK